MGRRRKRRTPSQITPRRALHRPPGNPPQPPSSNVDPARHQSPHEAALQGLATLARGWHLRCLPRVPPPKNSPLSRANRPAKHTTHRRGGGAGGGGTTSCRPTKHHRHSHPVKRNSGASQANVWRQPHGRSAASTAAGRTRPGPQSQRSNGARRTCGVSHMVKA